jgi:predicted AAA+ superfamily ATPase
MYYDRIIEKRIKENFFKEQIIVIYGPRQVGKTTMVKKFFEEYQGKKKFFRADIPSERDVFKKAEPSQIVPMLDGATFVIIDEAQLIENIGVVLKVMFDTHPEIQFIVTGSSSFDLANKIREPLTGRALEYMLYPLSYEEVNNGKGSLFMEQNFERTMMFGWYPRIFSLPNSDAKEHLEILQNNTLYKDILQLENIKKPVILEKLIQYLANNIGTVVRIGSIARDIRASDKTIERYIQILEKMFVIIKIFSYSRNPNNELKGGYKIYFIDIGLRNSVIKNHHESSIRLDKGALFENLFVMERIKFLHNHKTSKNIYFWQNYRQIEIDFIEESESTFDLYECKFTGRRSGGSNLFKKEYQDKVKNTFTITPENYKDFIH